MKTKVLTLDAKNSKEIEIPPIFFSEIREEICQKYYEILKKIQPYSPFYLAGKMYSASGIISHRRNKWKTSYGKGISRVPRKIFWRRGNQFYWQGATVSGTVGGRRSHPPKVEHFKNHKKINKKEKRIAFCSAIASTASLFFIKKRYSKLKEKEISIKFPIILKDELLNLKSKDFLKFLEKNLSELNDILFKKKRLRSGRGKLRNRKYKKNAGVLLVISNSQSTSVSNIDVKKIGELSVKDLWPLGRIVIYSEKVIEELKKPKTELKEKEFKKIKKKDNKK